MNERDERIDFLRGLALIVICLDHIHGNIVASFTPLALGYSDMAEVFVFLSGIVSVWSFERRAVRYGVFRAIGTFWVRAVVLYAAYVAGGTLLILWMRLTGTTAFISFHQYGAAMYPAGRLFTEIASCKQHVPHLTILPVYVLGLAILPILLMLGRRLPQVGRQALLLSVAAALYAAVQLDAVTLSAEMLAALYFHPASWLALFLAGAWLGLFPQAAGAASWPAKLWLAAFVFSGAGLILLMLLAHSQLVAPHLNKPELGPLRLIHFGLVSLLVLCLLPARHERYWKSVQFCGRQSLWVYLVGAFVSVELTAILQALGRVWWAQSLVNLAAICICLAVGFVAEWKRGSRPPSGENL